MSSGFLFLNNKKPTPIYPLQYLLKKKIFENYFLWIISSLYIFSISFQIATSECLFKCLCSNVLFETLKIQTSIHMTIQIFLFKFFHSNIFVWMLPPLIGTQISTVTLIEKETKVSQHHNFKAKGAKTIGHKEKLPTKKWFYCHVHFKSYVMRNWPKNGGWPLQASLCCFNYSFSAQKRLCKGKESYSERSKKKRLKGFMICRRNYNGT